MSADSPLGRGGAGAPRNRSTGRGAVAVREGGPEEGHGTEKPRSWPGPEEELSGVWGVGDRGTQVGRCEDGSTARVRAPTTSPRTQAGTVESALSPPMARPRHEATAGAGECKGSLHPDARVPEAEPCGGGLKTVLLTSGGSQPRLSSLLPLVWRDCTPTGTAGEAAMGPHRVPVSPRPACCPGGHTGCFSGLDCQKLAPQMEWLSQA